MTKRSRGGGPAPLVQLTAGAKALAHPARLRLLAMLADGELCVCQMTALVELAPSTVSQHLAVLARGGWIRERREGKLVFYRLAGEGPGEALLPPLLAALATDPQVRADRVAAARLRRVDVALLCAADLDLVAVGVRRPAARNPSPPGS
ncbi:MAG: metalloregulator ArsR/SmtB family transcription factor [Thermoanaerobaculia bacterium]|nr:metalloregulator ArsR/SmtB family transcription factor [Thermoanaerobaculia bacterium]